MFHRCVFLVFALPLLAAGLPYPALADDDDAGRLRVGLVLGGGGARGAAHIGVLRELERLRIPVDAIAGTSMGAIVGGLYATGMSAAELEALVASMDWAAALTDQSPRKDLSFRRKQDDREFPMDFEVGLRGGGVVIPQGVIQGQKLDLILRELTLDASHLSHFDELPIPFRAIATHIATGEAVVLDRGDLATAIRASMSVPAAFAPVEIDGKVLVDGGIAGNLAIDVVRTMDVDVVIAVDVEFPLYPTEDLDSALTISEQILTILIRKETLRQIETLGEGDVLIRPELGLFASTNFGGVTETIEPGIEATREQYERLEPLSLDEAAYREYVASRAPRPVVGERLAAVSVVHGGQLSPQVLEARLKSAPGDPIDADRLAADARRLYGLQLYERVTYRLVHVGDETGVEFHARPKSWGPSILQFGVSLEDDFEGSSAFNLAARHTRMGINRLGAEWRTDLQLGTDPLLFTEFYQPLSFNSKFFVAPRLELEQWNLNGFDGENTTARFRVSRAEAGLDVGYEVGRVGEFRSGIFTGVGEARVKVGDPLISNFDFDSGGAFAQFRFDSLDSAHFPRSGARADITWTGSRAGLGADNSFDTVEADLIAAVSRGKSTLSLGLSYATTIDSQSGIQDYFPLGGFLRLSGLERGNIAGPHAALAKLVWYRRVGSSAGGLFDTPVYLGASAEAGNVWDERAAISFESMQLNGSVFAGMNTFVGPVYLAAGFAEGGRTNFYLFVGSPPR